MANNRMWLVHRPTGIAVMLGKRMGSYWYNAPEKDQLERFFEVTGVNVDQDDLMLAMEDCTHSLCFDNWVYTDQRVEGFPVLKCEFDAT